jgi:hypothetical protein
VRRGRWERKSHRDHAVYRQYVHDDLCFHIEVICVLTTVFVKPTFVLAAQPLEFFKREIGVAAAP